MGESPPAADSPGEQAATISREMVRLMRKIVGRGPTKARTTIGRDQVIVVFQQTLTHGERTLVENGQTEVVEALRASYQSVLRDEATEMIEQVLDRKVLGFMSANHFNPDLAVEFFVLDPDGSSRHGGLQEAEHDEDQRNQASAPPPGVTSPDS